MNTIFLHPVLHYSLLWSLFLFSATSGAAPTINWTPPSVTQKVATGQTITVPVAFTASENINNALVRVVPTLAPFVATNPISFSSISKGQTVTLTLTISAVASSPIGTFEGTIQLKSGGQSNATFAKPLPVTVTTVTVINTPPISNAGPNQTIPVENTVALDGSASRDPDGNALTYAWSFKSVPIGSTAVLSSATSINPSFIPDKPGTYVVQLVVNDGTVDSTPSETQITAIMTPKQEIQSLEDQGALPRLDRSSDVQGTDINANGIRDDVETYIATNYTSTLQRAAAEQFARVIQSAMLVDKTDAVATKAIALRGSKAVNCIYGHFDGNAGSKQPAAVVEELKSVSTNTKARLLAYLAYSKALDGTTGALPEGDTCE